MGVPYVYDRMAAGGVSVLVQGIGCWVYSPTDLIVSSAMTMSGLQLQDVTQPKMNVYFSGTAQDVTVFNGASANVSNGGMLSAVTLQAGGDVFIYNGGTASGLYAKNQGGISAMSGAVLSNVHLSAGGSMYIEDSATLTGVTMSLGCAETYFNVGCLVSNLQMESGCGNVKFESGAILSGGTVSDLAWLNVGTGGTVYEAQVLSNGGISVARGGTAFVSQHSGGHVKLDVTGGENTYISGASTSDTFLASGGVASGFLIDGASNTMIVSVGGIARDTVVESGGTVHVLAAGTASGVIVKNSGYLLEDAFGSAFNVSIYSGGRANYSAFTQNSNTQIYSGGRANIFSSAVAVGFSAYGDDAYIYISSGGIISNCLVDGDGRIVVAQGSSFNTTVKHGVEHVSKGFAYYDNVSANGRQTVRADGYAESTTVFYNGDQEVSAGHAFSTTISSGGAITIIEGGTASYAHVVSGGTMIASGGAIVVSPAIDSGAVIIVRENAIFNGGGVLLTNNRNQVYQSSVSLSNYQVNDTALVLGGGSVINASANVGATIRVYSGGIVSNTTVSSRGTLEVTSGGTARVIYITNGAVLSTRTGGTINSLTIGTGATYDILSGATISSLYVDGSVLVSGGTLSDATVNNGGSVYLGETGSILGVTISSGGVFNGASVLWVSAAERVISGVTIKSGGAFDVWCANVASATIESGGTLGKFILPEDKTFPYTTSGEFIYSNGVISGNEARVFSGGSMSGYTVLPDGNIDIDVNANAENLLVWGGGVRGDVTSSSVRYPPSQSGSGIVTLIFTPWTSSSTLWGGTILPRDANTYYRCMSRGILSKIDDSSEFVIEDGGEVWAYSNGGLTNATIKSGGILDYASGAFIQDISISSGGCFYPITFGQYAYLQLDSIWTNLSHSKGMSVVTSHDAFGKEVRQYNLQGEGSASNIVWDVDRNTSMGGVERKFRLCIGAGEIDGMILRNTQYEEDAVSINNDGIAKNVVISNSGTMLVELGGQVTSTAISSGGTMVVSSAGIATSVTVSSGGTLSYSSESTVTNITSMAGGTVVEF